MNFSKCDVAQIEIVSLKQNLPIIIIACPPSNYKQFLHITFSDFLEGKYVDILLPMFFLIKLNNITDPVLSQQSS